MNSPTNNDGLGGGIPSDFVGAKPWIVMNEAQKNAHAEEMSANAEKIRAEAAAIRLHHPMTKLRIGGWYLLYFGIASFIGAGIGAYIMWSYLH